MADPESSDVLANLPAGRPTRRSSRRSVSSESKPTAGAVTAVSTPKATAAAKPEAPGKAKATTKPKPAVKATTAKAAAPKPKATAKPTPATGKASKPAARKKPVDAQAKAPVTAKAKAPVAAKAVPKSPVTKAAVPAAAKAAPAPRRPRLATPPEGRRADFSAGSATHRARKVTTNRPSLPASGFALPEDNSKAPLAIALGGLGSALADVARLSIGIAQSLTVRRREIEPPADDADREPQK